MAHGRWSVRKEFNYWFAYSPWRREGLNHVRELMGFNTWQEAMDHVATKAKD